MSSARTSAPVRAALAVAGAALLLSAAAGCSHKAAAPMVVPSDVHLAGGVTAALVTTVGTSTPVAARTDVGDGVPEPGAAVTEPGDPAGPAEPGTPAGPADSSLAARLGARSKAAARLEAAGTVALYCRLVDGGLLARAGELCAKRRLWSRRSLGSVLRFTFRSARIYAAPDARTLVLRARVRVLAGRGCPLPDGLAVVFFTLGRVGSAVGGWLITAVSTSPQPSRKGSL